MKNLIATLVLFVSLVSFSQDLNRIHVNRPFKIEVSADQASAESFEMLSVECEKFLEKNDLFYSDLFLTEFTHEFDFESGNVDFEDLYFSMVTGGYHGTAWTIEADEDHYYVAFLIYSDGVSEFSVYKEKYEE